MHIDPTGLLDYQPAAAEQLCAALDTYGGALDGSDMGVGKTAQACAVIRARRLPTAVVCPAVSITGWNRMGARLATEFSILNYDMIRTGRSPFGTWANPAKHRDSYFQCESCQQKFKTVEELVTRKCPHQLLGIHCLATKKKPHDYGRFIWHSGIKQLVFDEVHRCAALDSLQSDMLLAAKRQKIPVLGLSATGGETPLHFRALGYVLGLHSYTDFWGWASRRGCRRTTWGGFRFLLGEDKRKKVMADLHAEIFPSRGARVRIADLGGKFPEVQITAELYDLEKSGKLERLYSEMDDAIRQLNEKRVQDSEHPLTKLLRKRQEIELLKVPLFEELTHEALQGGNHVAIFVNFRQTVEALCKRLKTDCRVDGSQIGERGAYAREQWLFKFQQDEEPVIVCSSAAGCESIDLHDVRGDYARVGLVSLGHSARVTRQIFGRLRRAGGQSKAIYRAVLVANSPEVKIHSAVAGKLNDLDALNDGDLTAANLPLTAVDQLDRALQHE